MNLNEECLLQFLTKTDQVGQKPESSRRLSVESASLTEELKRVYRRDRYVSFPQAILIRRLPF